jgi:hypothetical protein
MTPSPSGQCDMAGELVVLTAPMDVEIIRGRVTFMWWLLVEAIK